MSNTTKKCTKCNKIKELSKFGRDCTHTDGLKSMCRPCRVPSSADHYRENRKRIRKRDNKWRQDNPEKVKERQKEYYQNNKEEVKEHVRKYAKSNKEKIKERSKKYKKGHRGECNARSAKREAAKLQATPKLTKDQHLEIKEIYIEAARRTKLTGIRHHVDHILPLQGVEIRGFHVPWNLQILTDIENSKKHNSFDGTYENEGWRKP